jgi:hypothetical protein
MAMLAGILDQLLDAFILRSILDWADFRLLPQSVSNNSCVGDFGEFVAHCVIDIVLDIETIVRHAHLTGALECSPEILGAMDLESMSSRTIPASFQTRF